MFIIYFRDLKEDIQKELLEENGISDPKELNWDIVPIAVIPTADTTDGEED